MFDLKICGYEELRHVIVRWKPSHVLSILNDMEPLDGNHLFIEVSDIPRPIEGHVHPQREHLEQVFAFTRDLTDEDRLLVHCYAGMSRSTAIAIGVLIQHGLAYDEAFKHVETIRPILMPNQMFIELIDEYFDLRGDLAAMVAEYRVSEDKRLMRDTTQESIDAMKALLLRMGY